MTAHLEDLIDHGDQASEALPKKKVWNTKNAAVLLDIPYRTFMQILDRGELPHLKIGRYYLIPDEALDAYIRERTVPARKPTQ